MREAPATMRLLTLTSLYPNAAQPHHGIFVENRLRHLLDHDRGITTRVVAPVPWFPFRHPRFGSYATFASAPRAEVRHGIAIMHPRHPVIPKVGMTAAPWLMARFVRPILERLRRDGFAFDRIDAHYFYPDGVAAALLARELGVPLSITARGSDLNIIADHPLARRMILWAALQADVLVTVSDGLRDRLVSLGAPEGRVTTVRNGVDLKTFRPAGDRQGLRARLGLPEEGIPVLLFVGNLIPLKRCHLVIEALARLPGVHLRIAGEGPERTRLEALGWRLGVAERVRFLGRFPQAELAQWYAACDLLVLPSEREGLPNVVLESIASGTPVVAARLPGTVEAVTDPAAGVLVAEATPAAYAEAIAARLATPVTRDAVRAQAESLGWERTSAALSQLLRSPKAARAAA